MQEACNGRAKDESKRTQVLATNNQKREGKSGFRDRKGELAGTGLRALVSDGKAQPSAPAACARLFLLFHTAKQQPSPTHSKQVLVSSRVFGNVFGNTDRSEGGRRTLSFLLHSMVAVAVWIRAQGRLTADATHPMIIVRLWPVIGASFALPLPEDAIDVCHQDYCCFYTWLEHLERVTLMGWRQRAGRHIRSRTDEAASENLVYAIDDVHEMVSQPRWLPVEPSTMCNDHLTSSRSRPLRAWLETMLGASIHFLCLLRTRLGPGTIPGEVWSAVVLQVLPCVESFGYSRPHARGGRPWVRLKHLPPLLSECSIESNDDAGDFDAVAVTSMLTWQDAARLRALGYAWAGTSSRGRAAAPALPNLA